MSACVQCGQPVESERECYALPTCYSCLPPPPMLRLVFSRVGGGRDPATLRSRHHPWFRELGWWRPGLAEIVGHNRVPIIGEDREGFVGNVVCQYPAYTATIELGLDGVDRSVGEPLVMRALSQGAPWAIDGSEWTMGQEHE